MYGMSSRGEYSDLWYIDAQMKEAQKKSQQQE